MKRRNLIRLALLAGITVSGLGFLVLWADGSEGINRRNAEKIRVGMQLAEVNDLIGVPPGDYSTPLLMEDRTTLVVGLLTDGDWTNDNRHRWICDTGFIDVQSDDDGKVLWSKFTDFPDTTWKKTRRLLHLY